MPVADPALFFIEGEPFQKEHRTDPVFSHPGHEHSISKRTANHNEGRLGQSPDALMGVCTFWFHSESI